MNRLSLILTLSLVGQAFAQSPFSIAPSDAFNKCPEEQGLYSVTMSQGTCQYDWILEGGRFENGSTERTGNNFTVIWNATDTVGRIRLKSRDCNPSSFNDVTIVYVYKIKSLANVSLQEFTGPGSVASGASTAQYRVKQATYPVGTAQNSPSYVEDYIWTVPPGWTVTSTPKSGGYAYLNVTPDACTGGTITVKGKSNCGNFFTNIATKTVTRTLSTPGQITPPGNVVCGSTTPITYSVPPVPGASSYVWTLPHPNWTGSSTTNSIVATPDGAHGGTLKVKALGCTNLESAERTLAINITLFTSSPMVSGPDLVCSSGALAPGTFSISNVSSSMTSESFKRCQSRIGYWHNGDC
jgi:hypothetical protein